MGLTYVEECALLKEFRQGKGETQRAYETRRKKSSSKKLETAGVPVFTDQELSNRTS
jgi:hypothetical protein